MKRIYKYPLAEITDCSVVSMPKDAEILCVQVQNNIPCLWAVVETDQPMEDRVIVVYGTGHAMSPDQELSYIGTFQIQDGMLVFHVFEEVQ